MYCKKCGEQIPDNSKFCPKCGAQVITAVSEGAEEETQAKKTTYPTPKTVPQKGEDGVPKTPAEKKRKIWIPVVIIIAVVAVVLIVLAATGAFSKKTIDLNDYVSVEFEGYDGYGTAKVTLNTHELGEDYNGKVKISGEAEDSGYNDFSDIVHDHVYAYASPSDSLSNGDEVAIDWKFSQDYFDEMLKGNVKFSYEPGTYSVSELKPIESFDAFDGVNVEFSGTSPDATATVVNNGSTEGYLDYILSQTDGLAIGDTVTVTISSDSANYYMQENGMYPAEMQKEFAVENINYYVSSLDEIPADGMEKLKSQSEDVFMSSVSSWSEKRLLDSIEYLGSYFLYEKPGVNNNNVNIIYMVYGIHAIQYGKTESGSQTETNVDYYWYAGFSNGMILSDGTFTIDYSDYSTPAAYSYYITEIGDGFVITTYDYTQQSAYSQKTTLAYTGYENLESMFNNLITSKIDKYTYESTVQE